MIYKKKTFTFLLVTWIVLLPCQLTFSQAIDGIPAFPEAEGFGAWATGGRGGVVYEVTNLNDDGTGSLREGVMTAGPRTIVFRVSGTIKLESRLKIDRPHITIAGQTAPGDGICIRDDQVYVSTYNVVIRHLRFRLGDEGGVQGDPAGGRYCRNLIVDHCSMSWSVDECASFYDNDSTTVQWCLIAESLYNSIHEKGPHGYGAIWGGKSVSYHHNLFAHHSSRNPRLNGSRYHLDPDNDLSDVRNNVVYNWGFNSGYGGEDGKQNIVANYFKAGPATSDEPKNYRVFNPTEPYGKFFVDENYVYEYPMVYDNNWVYGIQGPSWTEKEQMRMDVPYLSAPITETSAEQAYLDVIEKVGAYMPRKDSVDLRVLDDVINGTGIHGATFAGGGKGIIDSQTEVGGWPELKTYDVPDDSDHDGMPDTWEIDQGLNINDPEDRNLVAEGEVFTNLERYLNGLASDEPYLLRPIKLEAIITVDEQASLTWTDISKDETGFIIERAGRDGMFTEVASVAANTTEYTDISADVNQFYAYRVFAYNDELISLRSNLAEINSYTGISPMASTLKVFGYPNPCPAYYTLVYNADDNLPLHVDIYDMSGRQIQTLPYIPVIPGRNTITINLSDKQPGVYFIKCYNPTGMQSCIKVLKQ